METRCRITPTSIYARVKIHFAVHAIIACMVTIDAREHSRADQLRILARVNENLCEPNPQALEVTNRQVTDKRVEDFREDPSTLLGKQFILDGEDERDNSSLLYEAIEIRLTKGGKVFHVQFEGRSDCVYIASEEMAGMLTAVKRSTFVKISDDTDDTDTLSGGMDIQPLLATSLCLGETTDDGTAKQET
ncbi:hypothetical protein PILCRDRAFT_495258 [Piloderma croceum F 1598]|uniref:Uncharacterized protein n=1 Tax=Piloderma croceum (strain F 1598) TaxID=765440 RepID=A0A0C3FA39_PILCF|nr:hypothetical protein PILCRDRAFT_495258 [Piloderma croceum F 1598]